MTIEEMDKLIPGSLVKSKNNGYIYVVAERCGTKLILIVQEKMIGPDEWELVDDKPDKDTTFDRKCPWCGESPTKGIYEGLGFLLGLECDHCGFKIEIKKGIAKQYPAWKAVSDSEWLNKLTDHIRGKAGETRRRE